MKFVKVTSKNENEFRISDWKDDEGLIYNIDKELEKHGLEVVMGDYGDDNIWVKVEKKS